MPTELETLKDRLDRLETDFQHVLRLLQLDREELAGTKSRLKLVVETLCLASDKGVHGLFCTDENGEGCLSLFGQGAAPEKPTTGRITLRAGSATDGPLIELFGADNTTPRVQLSVNEDHGQAAVFGPAGVPRVVVKSMEKNGAVTVCDPTGGPLAVLWSKAEGGQIDLLNTQKTSLVKGQATANGGFLSVQTVEGGRPRATLSSHGEKGTLMILDKNEKAAASLTSSTLGGLLILGDPESSSLTAQLGVDANGGWLEMTNADGEKSCTINSLPTGGDLRLFDHVGDLAVSLTIDADGGAVRVAAGPDGKERASLQVLSGKYGCLSIHDGHGSLRSIVGAGDHGGFVGVMNNQGQAAATLEAIPQGGRVCTFTPDGRHVAGTLGRLDTGSGLVLSNDAGQPRLIASITAEDSSMLALHSDGSHPQVLLQAEAAGGQLTLFDSEGDPSARLPE